MISLIIGAILESVKSVIQTTYDIFKPHGGEIKVETKKDEGLPGEHSGSHGHK